MTIEEKDKIPCKTCLLKGVEEEIEEIVEFRRSILNFVWCTLGLLSVVFIIILQDSTSFYFMIFFMSGLVVGFIITRYYEKKLIKLLKNKIAVDLEELY